MGFPYTDEISCGLNIRALGMASALLAAGTVWGENNIDPEPASRLEMGWEVKPQEGRWSPDYASNRSGTFIRLWGRFFLLEGMREERWKSLGNTFTFGGVLPATALTSIYMMLYGANALGLMSAGNRLATSLSYAGYGVGTAAMLYTWAWQLKNIVSNGVPSGFWYLGAHFAGGLESHQQGMQSYRESVRRRVRAEPRDLNTDSLMVPAALLIGWLLDNTRGLVTSRMVNSLDIQLPPCLADQVFMDIQGSDSETGGVTLRVHRIPKALRDEQREQYPQGCSAFRNLIKVMDRDRIDRLTIKPSLDVANTSMLVEFLDHRQEFPGKLFLTVQDHSESSVWLEDVLASGISRRDVEKFRSTLHPDYLDMITQALSCYRDLPKGEAIAQCAQGTLHRTNSKERRLNWMANQRPSVTTWVHEKPNKTIFYFNLPTYETSSLSWQDAYGGPYLELRDGSDTEVSQITHYRFSERVSYALTGELDYLVRYLPHMLLGRVVIPGMQLVFNSNSDTLNGIPGMSDIEAMSVRYAPGWLTNLYSILRPTSEYYLNYTGPKCPECGSSYW